MIEIEGALLSEPHSFFLSVPSSAVRGSDQHRLHRIVGHPSLYVIVKSLVSQPHKGLGRVRVRVRVTSLVTWLGV